MQIIEEVVEDREKYFDNGHKNKLDFRRRIYDRVTLQLFSTYSLLLVNQIVHIPSTTCIYVFFSCYRLRSRSHIFDQLDRFIFEKYRIFFSIRLIGVISTRSKFPFSFSY
jgi:hypothetical protein